MAGIWLNEDNSHYFFTRAEKASDMNEIESFANQFKKTNVERVMLCGNAQKTNFLTKVGSVIYEDVDTSLPFYKNRDSFVKWSNAVKDIDEKSIDIYGIWINMLRDVGVSPWMSMRMNDVHNADNDKDPIHSSFYKNHLDYRRSMYRDEKWEDRQLNYMIEEVQDYHFNILKEYFEKYDFDGIELDWMRFGNHFPAGYEDDGRGILNDFMKKARELSKEYEIKRGHSIEIGARVPVKPETAFNMGMDGVGWALEGLVDYLAPSPFWHTSQADIPVERWKRQVAGTGCKIAPCIELCLRQYAFPKCRNDYQFNSMETIRGAAVSFIDRGADAIYLFNYMDNQDYAHDQEKYEHIIRETGNYKAMQNAKRRHVLTFNDRQPEGEPSDERLPCSLKKGVFTGFRLHTGNLQENQKHLALLSFLTPGSISPEKLMVFVNSKICGFIGEYDPGNPKPKNQVFAWEIPSGAHKSGYQVIEVQAAEEGFTLDWVEILIDIAKQ